MKILIILSCYIVIFANTIYSKPYYEFTEAELKGKKVSLFGSFTCYETFIEVMDYFESKGAKILCPIRSKIVDINADFRLFKDDHLSNKTEKELQQVVFDKTRKYADIVYIVNGENCRLGIGTASEVGYVLALNDIRNAKIHISVINYIKNKIYKMDKNSLLVKIVLKIKDTSFVKYIIKHLKIKNIDVLCWEKPNASHIRFFCKY
jgi:hypothetical protein